MEKVESELSAKVVVLLFLFLFLSFSVKTYSMYVEKVILPSYYGYSYDINWDGHDAYLYSYISDFDTSTSYPIKIGTDYTNANEWGRGHVQFDLSSIPSNATILSVGLEMYVGYVGQWSDEWDSHHARVLIYSMWRNQANYSPHDGDVYTYDLFNDAGDGTLYGTTGYITMDNQFDEYFPSDTSWFDLGPACVDSVQNRIASGIEWFGLGFTHYDPNEDLDEGVDLFGKLTKLHIVYQPADGPLLQNPSISPDSGNANTIFKFSVDYIDSTGYEPDTALVIIDDSIKIPLTLTAGSATNGSYSVKTTVSDTGLHSYYFRFTDTQGNVALYPADAPNATLSGPYVNDGFGITVKRPKKTNFSWFLRDDELFVKSDKAITSMRIYSITGACLLSMKYDEGKSVVKLSLRKLKRQILLCNIKLENGKDKIIKVVNIR